LLWHLFFSAAWHLLDPHDPRPETKNFARPSRRINAWKMCILWLSWGLLCVSALMHLPPSHFIHWWSEICINIYDLRIQTGWTRVEPSPCWRDTLLIGGCIIGLNLCFPLCLEGCSLHFASSRASRHWSKSQPLQGALYQWHSMAANWLPTSCSAAWSLSILVGSKNKAGWKLQYTGYPSIAKSNHDRMSIAFLNEILWVPRQWCDCECMMHDALHVPNIIEPNLPQKNSTTHPLKYSSHSLRPIRPSLRITLSCLTRHFSSLASASTWQQLLQL
jgi:hypothetical protein